jgi:hypothetical protein
MSKQKYEIADEKSKIQKNFDGLKKDNKLVFELLDSVLVNQSDILSKLSGSTIGKVQEKMTILELKSSFPNDQFSDEESDKHGTDIISTVWESGINLGKITISVKHQNRWSYQFVTQLEENIRTDNTRWGFLVTTTFPADALNHNIWTARTASNRLILLVKPQFVSIAYYAVRNIILYEHQLREIILNPQNIIDLPSRKKITETIVIQCSEHTKEQVNSNKQLQMRMKQND